MRGEESVNIEFWGAEWRRKLRCRGASGHRARWPRYKEKTIENCWDQGHEKAPPNLGSLCKWEVNREKVGMNVKRVIKKD